MSDIVQSPVHADTEIAAEGAKSARQGALEAQEGCDHSEVANSYGSLPLGVLAQTLLCLKSPYRDVYYSVS